MEWCETFLQTIDVSERSQDRYAASLKSFTDWCGNRYGKLSHISGTVAVRYFDSISGWAKNTRKAQKSLLSKVWEEAKIRGLVEFRSNPFHEVAIKRGPGSRVKNVLSDEDIAKIMQSKMPHWLKLATWVCLYTGCRGDNLKDLKWSDISEGTKTISFRHSKTTAYTVPIHRNLRIMLHFNYCLGGGGFLFPKLQGKSDAYLSNTFARWMKRIGVSATLHCLRHTCNSRLISSGVSKQDAMSILNHSSATVNDIYTHADSQKLIGQIEKLNYGT